MKKICYFINSDWYFNLHWFDRAKGTQEAGYDVHIISDFKDAVVKDKLEKQGFNCYDSKLNPQSLNPFSFIISFIYIFHILRKIDVDILHCITIKPCLIGGLYSRLYGKKAVISFVGLGRVFSAQNRFFRIIQFLVLPIYRFIFHNPKVRLIFEHERDRVQLVELTHIANSKTIVIDGAGIDTSLYSYQKEKDNNVPSVLFASRLLKSKGLHDLVSVKKMLLQEGLVFNLNVAGIMVKDDPDALDVKLLEKWHQQGLINWLGQRSDVETLIANSHIVALPSVYPEGVPRILIEGASVGRALIAYDSGGCSSIINNNINGFLISKGNLIELKEKLKKLLTDAHLRNKMGLESRALVLNKFSSSIVLYKTLAIYQGL